MGCVCFVWPSPGSTLSFLRFVSHYWGEDLDKFLVGLRLLEEVFLCWCEAGAGFRSLFKYQSNRRWCQIFIYYVVQPSSITRYHCIHIKKWAAISGISARVESWRISLGGGNSNICLLFASLIWGRFPFWQAYFSKGVGWNQQPGHGL